MSTPGAWIALNEDKNNFDAFSKVFGTSCKHCRKKISIHNGSQYQISVVQYSHQF